MLLACSKCHRQYDVSSLETGAQVRCYCGESCTVPDREPQDAPMVHCGSCGGRLAEGATNCEYCHSQVMIGDRGFGLSCPECFARLLKDAHFCCSCGTEIRPLSATKAVASEACPRCQGQMNIREVPGAAFTECSACGGMWLDEEVFEKTTREHEASTIAQSVQLPHEHHTESPQPLQDTFRYIPCPVCGEMMNRKNFAACSGVIIDWCRGHGYWFDNDELAQIILFIEDGGLEKARDRQNQMQKYEREATWGKAGGSGYPATIPTAPEPDWSFSGRSLFDVLGAIVGRVFRSLR